MFFNFNIFQFYVFRRFFLQYLQLLHCLCLCFCPLSMLAVAVVEFPLVWLVNNDSEYVMCMVSETSSLFDEESWWTE